MRKLTSKNLSQGREERCVSRRYLLFFVCLGALCCLGCWLGEKEGGRRGRVEVALVALFFFYGFGCEGRFVCWFGGGVGVVLFCCLGGGVGGGVGGGGGEGESVTLMVFVGWCGCQGGEGEGGGGLGGGVAAPVWLCLWFVFLGCGVWGVGGWGGVVGGVGGVVVLAGCGVVVWFCVVVGCA